MAETSRPYDERDKPDCTRPGCRCRYAPGYRDGDRPPWKIDVEVEREDPNVDYAEQDE